MGDYHFLDIASGHCNTHLPAYSFGQWDDVLGYSAGNEETPEDRV